MKSKNNSELRAVIQEIAKNVLSEEGPDVHRVDQSIMDRQIEEFVLDTTMEMAHQIVYDARVKLLKDIAYVVNQHGMTSVRLTPNVLGNMIDDTDEDAISEVEMEVSTDIADALLKYAKKLGEFAVGTVGVGPHER